MFYYLLRPILVYNGILIAAAVVPAFFLMLWVYRSDRLEKESPMLLRRLVVSGVLASLAALVAERVLSVLLNWTVPVDSKIHGLLLYFGIVAFSEEGAKYFFLRRSTWQHPSFDCQYDGVVYAVFVSLGFALWENISYVLTYGFSTALVRAVTAIPGHACFGVFMGVFYGIARKYENGLQPTAARTFRVLALLVPALLHGAYDYIATLESLQEGWFFALFVVILFAVSFLLVGHTARRDRYIR